MKNPTVQQKYAKIVSGLAFEVMDSFYKKDCEFKEELRKLCEEVGANPKCYSSMGWALIGLKPVGAPPKGWRMSKQMPGMMIPDKTKKVGKDWAKRLEKFRIPQTEELAHALGFPSFFRCLAGNFCTNVGYIFRGGIFRLSYPACLDLKHPHEAITYEEYSG